MRWSFLTLLWLHSALRAYLLADQVCVQLVGVKIIRLCTVVFLANMSRKPARIGSKCLTKNVGRNITIHYVITIAMVLSRSNMEIFRSDSWYKRPREYIM